MSNDIVAVVEKVHGYAVLFPGLIKEPLVMANGKLTYLGIPANNKSDSLPVVRGSRHDSLLNPAKVMYCLEFLAEMLNMELHVDKTTGRLSGKRDMGEVTLKITQGVSLPYESLAVVVNILPYDLILLVTIGVYHSIIVLNRTSLPIKHLTGDGQLLLGDVTYHGIHNRFLDHGVVFLFVKNEWKRLRKDKVESWLTMLKG